MVRHYIRKTIDHWSKSELFDALEKIKIGEMKIKEAATKYHISSSTLYRHLKNPHKDGNVDHFKRNGRTILTSLEETVLENVIKNLRTSGQTVSATDIKRICFEYCFKHGIPTKFKANKRLAGNDWYIGFLRRHPDLVIKKTKKRKLVKKGKS